MVWFEKDEILTLFRFLEEIAKIVHNAGSIVIRHHVLS